MTDDRDRRAAEEWWTHGLDLRDTTEACVESLAALLTAARAEGAATLKAAAMGVVEAGDIVDDCYPEERKLRAALDALRVALEESP